jgi:hypothetical protein
VPEALGNRPSAEQLLLLHAALDEPQAAAKSWKRWCTTVGLDNADPASLRLLPVVYTRELHQIPNLAGREFDAVRMRRIYRDAWIRNRLLFERAAAAIGALGDAGIETLAIKGRRWRSFPMTTPVRGRWTTSTCSSPMPARPRRSKR